MIKSALSCANKQGQDPITPCAVGGWKAFWVVVLSGKLLLALAVFGAVRVPLDDDLSFADADWPRTQAPTMANRLSAWDAAHYLKLASEGYKDGSPSCAFYPLWPASIWLATMVTRISPVWTSMLLANALSLLSFWLFFRLVERHCGLAISRNALILLMTFPAAFFFSFPYTESLYLIITLWFFWSLELKHWWFAGIAAFLLPMTRAVGVFIILPLAWHLWERKKPWWNWTFVLLPILGYISYFCLMHAWTGNALEGFEAQKNYPYSPSIRNMFDFPAFWSAFINARTLVGMTDSALDRVLFLLFLGLLPSVWKLNKTWFWYTLPTGLVPAMTSYFMSYRRYIVVLFPLFIVMTYLLAKRPPWMRWYYVILLAAVQVWLVFRFVNFYWAG